MCAKLKMRAMEPEDVDTLYDVENNTSLWQYGTANVPYSRSLLRDFVLNTTGDIYTDKQVRLVVENDKGVVVGMADLTDFSPKNMRAEVGIVILSQFQGLGYANEVVRMLSDYARSVLLMHQLYAYVDPTNQKCLRALQGNGFQIVATMRHWIRVGEDYHDVVMAQKIF